MLCVCIYIYIYNHLFDYAHEFKWAQVDAGGPNQSKWGQINQVSAVEQEKVNLSEPNQSKWIQLRPSEPKWVQEDPKRFLVNKTYSQYNRMNIQL